MWTSLPYIDLLCIMLLLVLSINVVTTVGRPLGEDVGDNADETDHEMSNEDLKSRSENDVSSRNTVPCWVTENFTAIGSCTSCQPFTSKVFSESCEATGFNQLIRCTESDQKVYKSCPRSRTSIEKSFWVFEGVTFFIGLFFGLIVFCRRRKLNHEAAERVRKQISNSV